MIYIRKKSKGFGKNKRIEGNFKPNSNILLVEDLATDGGSKMSFVNAIRDAGGQCNSCFVIFHYNIFKQKIDKLKAQNVSIVELATWKNILDVLYRKKIPESEIKSIESFLKKPDEWKPK
jgi:Orotate phosphoribosyltransferase